LCKSTYISVINYRCESWSWYSIYNSQLQAKEIRHLRRIEGKTKRERIRDQIIRMELRIIPLKEMIVLAQLRFFGQVLSMGDDTYP